MIYSRFLVSSSHRFSIPLRWLGDLARRGSLSYPTGQGPATPRRILFKGRHLRWDKGYARSRGGRHLRRNVVVYQQSLEELAAWVVKEYGQSETMRLVQLLIRRFNEVNARVPR